MLPLITCKCGRSIGDIYDLYKILCRQKIEKYLQDNKIDIKPELISISDEFSPEMRDIFEILSINLMCCKTSLMTNVEFSSLY